MTRFTDTPALCILVHAEGAPSAGPQDRASTRFAATWSQGQETPLVYASIDDWAQHKGTLTISGWRPCLQTNRWLPCQHTPVRAIYNRYPLQRAPQRLRALAQAASSLGIPMANHPALQTLVWDKWDTQTCLSQAGLAMPEATLDPATWTETLRVWERAYLKPRCGAFGQGILYLSMSPSGEILLEGPIPGQRQNCHSAQLSETLATLLAAEPAQSYFLQRAIAPPLDHLRGFCIRSLVQRTHTNEWRALHRVARCSPQDPVANVARNAVATPLEDLCGQHTSLPASLPHQLDQLDQEIAEALQQTLSLPFALIELGIDYLVDPYGQPWVLEINGFPQGRLDRLATQNPQRFQDSYQQTHTQPLQTLAAWTSPTPLHFHS